MSRRGRRVGYRRQPLWDRRVGSGFPGSHGETSRRERRRTSAPSDLGYNASVIAQKLGPCRTAMSIETYIVISIMPCFFRRYGSTMMSSAFHWPTSSSCQLPKMIAWQIVVLVPLVRFEGTLVEASARKPSTSPCHHTGIPVVALICAILDICARWPGVVSQASRPRSALAASTVLTTSTRLFQEMVPPFVPSVTAPTPVCDRMPLG